jgi:3-deoxy-manno-octulosonate cytidylyltransferase (CMP-KDO synthetase)
LASVNEQRRAANKDEIDIVLNLQGDNPFASETAIAGVLLDLIEHDDHMVATPILPLDWEGLDALRAQKMNAPFSGTTVTVAPNGKALWFSKNIIPAVRKEAHLRTLGAMSPIYRHIGLYGYKRAALQTFVSLPESQYEALEGLEQLRFLENNIDIYTVRISKDDMPPISGIDSAEDLAHAHDLIAQNVIKIPDFSDA